MAILVLNCGSSSVKYRLYRDGDLPLARGMVEKLNTPGPQVVHEGGGQQLRREVPEVAGHRGAVELALRLCMEGDRAALSRREEVRAVGHRVVHGGEEFSHPTLVTDEVIDAVRRYARLAPLHNPANLAGILAARELLPGCPQVAVFDTAFHTTLPEPAYLYALPYEWYRQHRVRRYGFHGISHQYVSTRIRELLGVSATYRTIVCHLGNGASVSAVRDGRCIDTSMGFTPLEGLVMGTRSGDVDPSLVLYAQQALGLPVAEVDRILNRESGLLGLSQLSPDMRDIQEGVANGHAGCRRAWEATVYRLVKYVGAYTAALGGLDCLVFTAGIGENSPALRREVAARLEHAGVVLDAGRNDGGDAEREIGAAGSAVRVWVVPSDEEGLIARETASLVAGR
ncbi:MAG TPA: acetate kinase [Clostridiales bacterium UBA8153]|nr:acetate kinase [Clostridiales bacterium UBA8153]